MWPNGSRVPFGTFHIIDRDECRFAAHRQSHIIGCQTTIHFGACGIDAFPRVFRVRPRDSRILVNTSDGHFKLEFNFRLRHAAGNWSRRLRRWRGRQRNMAFAGQQS